MPRGSKPGERRGGRKKGTPNKQTQDLLEKARELGVDPFEILLLFAGNRWKQLGYENEKETRFTNAGIEFEEYTISPDLRVHAAKEACQYIHPKRKAIEVTADNNNKNTTVFRVKWADEDEPGDVATQAKDSASEANQSKH